MAKYCKKCDCEQETGMTIGVDTLTRQEFDIEVCNVCGDEIDG
jgi:hypothetical protein